MSALSPRQHFALNEACKPIAEAFGNCAYLVGTASVRDKSKSYRDVDVRLILWDEAFDRLREAIGLPGITFLGFAVGEYLAKRTDLPIDFQIQRQTEANEKHKGVRNAIGIHALRDYHGDAHPQEEAK